MTTAPEKLTKAQAALLRVVKRCGRRGITRRSLSTPELRKDVATARKAGLLQDGGLETSVEADDWLDRRGDPS